MRKKRTGVSVGTILYVVLLVILSLVLVIQISYIASELRDNRYDYSTDEDDYIRMTTYENYYRILDEATNDSRLGKKRTEVEQEIRALGFYYEAATLYKAYLAIDDSESAEQQKTRMERYREKAGSYSAETGNIDELLGIS
jgi:hypothetical protein